MAQFIILKQFYPNAEIWVAKLNDSDPEYIYPTWDEAITALPTVQELYPNNKCKVSNPIVAVE
jgi:hypothetical protein